MTSRETQALVPPEDIVKDVSASCQLPVAKVAGAVELLRAGNTIPFVARYRKERTGGLDELALRAVDDSLTYFRELADRKQTVLGSIAQQGKLNAALEAQIRAVKDRRELEEIYLPYKPKRRTRATIARERGLDPLAQWLRSQVNSGQSRAQVLEPFVDPHKDVPDGEAALAGACDIIAEEWAEDSDARAWLRTQARHGVLISKAKRGQSGKTGKFEMYYDHREPLSKVPSHRYLAMRRGEAENVLRIGTEVDRDPVIRQLTARFVENPSFLFHRELLATVEDCYHRLLFPAVESALLTELKHAADEEAIGVFSKNLREILLAPPAGQRVVLGIDPGYRTGCKVSVVDVTGKLLQHATIYPTPPRNDVKRAAQVLRDLIERHRVELIAIGNGTASRETDAFVASVLTGIEPRVAKVTVNESGASIYSASEVAREEFPDLDVTIRGAVSIARRLQDPLAELVKIDPKSLGVGQYQHDVNQPLLRKALDREVESCVNRVGVDVNTASARLLAYVAGIGPRLAATIVEHRAAQGPFTDRQELLAVPRLAAKSFLQAAGFLRVRGGAQPLDNSAVHPESYHVVERMARSAGVELNDFVGNAALIRTLEAERFVDGDVGLPTVLDILAELEKPGRDPRREFRVARFAEGVNDVSDLKEGMFLEGVVTNVTRFGVFVDIGVHQDGLVHVSELDRRFVKDPADLCAVGDIVRVKVLKVDEERGRIALSRKQAL